MNPTYRTACWLTVTLLTGWAILDIGEAFEALNPAHNSAAQTQTAAPESETETDERRIQ